MRLLPPTNEPVTRNITAFEMKHQIAKRTRVPPYNNHIALSSWQYVYMLSQCNIEFFGSCYIQSAEIAKIIVGKYAKLNIRHGGHFSVQARCAMR